MSDCLISASPAATYDGGEPLAAVRGALEPLGGMAAFVKPGSRVLLKPNFVRAMHPDSAAVTHPAFIAAVAVLAREAGAAEVLVGDSPGFGSAANAAKRMGLHDHIAPAGARVVEFTQVRRIRTGLHSGVFQALSLSGEALDADILISLPKAKAHCQMVLTGAVKNLFGCIPGRKKALMHCMVKNSRYLFGRMLVDNARSLNAALHIMDGIVAMERDGPTRGTPRPWGWVLAGADPFAMDRVMAEALGYALEELPHLMAARDMKAGEMDLARIGLAGAAMEDLRLPGWVRADLLPITFNPVRLAIGYLKHRLQWRTA